MKKMKACLLILFVSFLVNPLYSQMDSVNTNLNLSVEVVKKPDNKDTADIIKYKNEPAQEKAGPSAMSITIWIIMSWSFFLILISIPFYFNHKKIKARQLIINNLIEKGREIPKELLTRSSVNYRSDFHKGVILIALGASVIIVLLSVKIENNYWTVGLIPMFIGIAYLVTFKFDKTNKKRSEID